MSLPPPLGDAYDAVNSGDLNEMTVKEIEAAIQRALAKNATIREIKSELEKLSGHMDDQAAMINSHTEMINKHTDILTEHGAKLKT